LVNSRTPPVTIDTIEGEMISSSDTLSLISQHLPIQWDIPDGKIHFIFVNLQKSGSDKTFMKDLVTSPDIPVYKVIYELHPEIVFESPVRSGFLTPRVIDRDQDWSFEIEIGQKTGLNQYGPVFCSLLQLQDRSKLVMVQTGDQSRPIKYTNYLFSM